MNWVWVILAVLALAGAAGCFWGRRRIGGELALMSATPTSPAAQAAKLPAGTLVEVKGVLRCERPLMAELSKESCVYFKSDVQRETVYYQNDSQGKRERRTRTETVQSNMRHAPCVIEDASGTIAVDLDGADIDAQQVVNRREQEQRSLAAVVVNAALGGGDSSTLIYTEAILPIGIPIYALGEVRSDGTLGKPSAASKARTFVISRKSEEERSKDLGSSMFWLQVGGFGLGALAVALAIVALMTRTG